MPKTPPCYHRLRLLMSNSGLVPAALLHPNKALKSHSSFVAQLEASHRSNLENSKFGRRCGNMVIESLSCKC